MAQPYGHSVANNAIIPKYRIAANDNATKMIDSKASAQFRFSGKINTSEDLREQFQEFIDNREGETHRAIRYPITPVPKTIDNHYPKSLTRPLAFVGAPILADVLEHAIAPWNAM